jgi:hypothetical protein
LKKFIWFTILGIMLFLAFPIRAQETVDITLPANVSFDVVKVNETTEANSVTLSYIDANLNSGNYLRISIKANAANFTRPSNAGDYITASSVSWTTSNAQGGSGVNGTLSSVTYNIVYESNTDPTSGSLSIKWELAAPGSGIRAGGHTLNCTWKIESLTP